MNKEHNFVTDLIHDSNKEGEAYGAVVPPIYQNSLFTFSSWAALEQAFQDKVNSHIYTRGNNPTVTFVEKKIAKLAKGEKSKLFASGMAAVSSGILHFMNNGDHMITLKNIYGPAHSLLNNFMVPKMGVEVTYVSGNDIEEIKNSIQPNTKLIYLESPTSVTFIIQDIEKIVEIAKKHNIATVIDNSWATPIFQKTLPMGIDLEVHSCSKYLGGHSDIIAGALIGRTDVINSIAGCEYELLGAKLSPHEASLLLRSLRTLDIRMAKHQSNALFIAEFLEKHEKIKNITYPGLKSFNQHELACKQMSGFSGLISFQLNTNDLTQIIKFFDSLKLFQKGVSWGGHESLIYAPAISCIRELTEEQINMMGITLGDMRISIGLEDKHDLLDDLIQALDLI